MTTAVTETDKQYWHRYIDFYEEVFAGFECRSALEFGVWRGASVRWLLEKFPDAKIFGADILPVQESWPVNERTRYFHVDQSDPVQIDAVYDAIGAPLDLVLEDGSHIPQHQKNCLVRSLGRINPGGIYILEDIHTSHPAHPWYRKAKPMFRPMVGVLHLLLAFDHLRDMDPAKVPEGLAKLSKDSLFSAAEVEMLFAKIASMRIYKRSRLPKRCFACGKDDFDYANMKCSCGVELYAQTDSMSVALRVR